MSLTSLRSTNRRPCIGSALVYQTKQLQQKNNTARAEQEQSIPRHLSSIFPYFLFFITKHERQQSGKLFRWPQCLQTINKEQP